MTTPTFEDAPIPEDVRPPELDDNSGALRCSGCGASLTYAGRGRPPTKCDACKSSRRSTGGTTPRGSGKVAEALGVMNGAYDALGLALMLVSPQAAVDFAPKIPALQERNAAVFAADPQLARRIARLGARGGMPAFVATQVVVIGPVIRVAVQDWRERHSMKDEGDGADNPEPSRLFGLG